MKENVICGRLIPAGTGLREYQTLVVGDKNEMALAEKARQEREMIGKEED
jgi:DNA-directed RNA polymerase subunit beta'